MGMGEGIGGHERPFVRILLAILATPGMGQERQSAQQQHAPAAHRHAAVVMSDRAL
ncbi:hypothetical protein OEM_45720 [Mycobacterium intracellulare subsp. yongonense 05-1390]|nr:hypothetical protein OEM_45720 [Mycobacterium intracellulare subsp. yongonense 05-1390]